MDLTNLKTSTADLIYRQYELKNKKQKRRKYLGGSEIGDECERKLWLSYRWADKPNFSGRLLRLFQYGHDAEPRIVNELRGIGCDVWEVNSNGKQFEVSFLNGRLLGHADGVIMGLPRSPKTPHLAEFKTANDRSFKDMLKKGVEKSKPVHYAQMQLYMKGLELTRAIYIVENKNTSELYTERVKYNADYANQLLAKASRILDTPTAPVGISQDPTFYKCKWCDYSKVCHGQEWPLVNCRTCIKDCKNEAGNPCSEHLFNPELVFSHDSEVFDNYIEYTCKETGEVVLNVCESGFPPRVGGELCSSELLRNGEIATIQESKHAVKELFLTCDICLEARGDVINRIDPYREEIGDYIEYKDICNGCYSDLLMDI